MWFIGKISQRLQDNESALTWFERACKVNDTQPDVVREASIAAMELGLHEKALLFARRAEQLRPSDRGLTENLAIALVLAGRCNEAKDVVEHAPNETTNDLSRPLVTVIDHLITTGADPPRTLMQLEQLIARIQ